MPAAAKDRREDETHRTPGKRTRSTVRVSNQTHRTLCELAEETGEPMQHLIAVAVEAMRRRRILEMTNAAYAAMRADPERWQEELGERNIWDTTLADGVADGVEDE